MLTDIMLCSYSYHSAPFQMGNPDGLKTYLFRLQTEGYCEALVDGRMEPVAAGDLLLYKPGDPYQLHVAGRRDNGTGEEQPVSSGDYFVICNGPWIDEWWHRKERPRKTGIAADERLLSIWRALILEKRRFEEENKELADYLLRSLCLELDRAADMQSALPGKSFIAARMKSFIEERASGPVQVREVARHVDLSVSRAVHLFKECFGLTIIQYTQNVRLALAMERMKYSTMSLEHIAESCGFGSYSYFYRVFRGQYGMSPAVYRARQM